MDSQKNKNKIKLFYIFAFLFTMWGIYKSVFYGCDIDESYAVTLSYRLVMGDSLFKEMWEIHQTSAVFLAPFIWVYRILNGTTIGLVVFLRLIGIIVQGVISAFIYIIFKKMIKKEFSLILALLFFNFSPKYSQVMDFCFLEYLFLMCIVVSFLYYCYYKKNWILIFCGLFKACAILAYPQTVLAFPFEILIFVMLKKKDPNVLKQSFFCFGTEVICGIVFSAYVLKNISLTELIGNVPYILNDGSHSSSAVSRITDLLLELKDYLIPWLLLIIIIEIVQLRLKKQKNFSRFQYTGFLCFLYAIVYSFIQTFIMWYDGIQHLDLSRLILNFFLVLAYLLVRFRKEFHLDSDYKVLFCFVTLPVVFCFIASNLSIYGNGGLLLPVVIYMLYLLLCGIQNMENSQVSTVESLPVRGISNNDTWTSVILTAFFLCILVARMTLIRYSAVQPISVFDSHYVVEVGVLKGVRLIEREHIHYHNIYEAVAPNVTADDTLLVFGSDDYYYMFTGSKVAEPSTISTPVYDESLYEYYIKYPDKVPSIILIDNFNQSFEKMMQVPKFGDWVRDNYDLNNIKEYAYCSLIYHL